MNELADVEHFWIWLLRPPYNVGGKFKTTDKLASALRQVLADEELKRVEEIERQTLSLIADFLKRTLPTAPEQPPALLAEIDAEISSPNPGA